MDLLSKTYSKSSSSDSDEHDPQPPKRLKLETQHYTLTKPSITPSPQYTTQIPPRKAQLPGRYVSKRERALLSSSAPVPSSRDPPDSRPHLFIGNISDSYLPHGIRLALRGQNKDCAAEQLPSRMSVALNGHTKAVNAVRWSPTHAHLLASAGMDQTIHIWNVWNRDQKKARVFNFHSAAVKDVKWSPQGLFLLSSGYDCSSRLIDVEKGVETRVFKDDQSVSVVNFHPENSNMFLAGGSKGHLKLWDIRNGQVVHQYVKGLGPVLDVEFTANGKQFISSSDVSGSNISEYAITVWDVSREVVLSNQVYVEAYTCPCLRRHPFEPFFVAQSNGNYIAIFSLSPPFKLNKYKRYESHAVSGFPVKCDFSLDGEKLVSGSSDGSIYFYDYRSSQLVKKIKAYEHACIDVAFHPIMSNVIASCSWNGSISVFE